MIALAANGIEMEYGTDVVLDGVSFTVQAGEKIGLIGPNGAGKSTLLRILHGDLAPTSGSFFVNNDLRVGLLRQEKTGADTLSGGERARKELSELFLQKPDVLFLDEPTNHLDLEMLAQLERRVKAFPGTVVLISHDRYFLDRTVSRIFELEDGRLTAYGGNYTAYREKKRVLVEAERRAFEHSMKEIRRQEELIRRFKERGTEKLAKRAASREKRLAHAPGPEAPKARLHGPSVKVDFGKAKRSGDDVLLAENLSKAYAEGVPLFAGVELALRRGEKVCMIGSNGVGKTTLLNILAGRLSSDTGIVERGANVKIGVYDQHQAGLTSENTLLEEMRAVLPWETDTDLRSLLGRFLFRGDKVFQGIASLSGGEKARLSLLKLIVSGANVLFLDEPTNHLDVASMDAVEDALSEFDGTLLIISHDRWLLERLPSRILELTGDGLVSYAGNFDYYKEKKADFESGRLKAAPTDAQATGHTSGRFAAYDDEKPLTAAAVERQRQKQEEAARRRYERQVADVETLIQTLEADIAALEARQSDGNNATDYELLAQLHEEITEKQAALDAAYERWAELDTQHPAY
ncbi:MAG: ABC-F family ATP-binding cassette domain-containing protein [Clostridiales Family XIII bacterium]|jgi:ATP-binding cassette subfamily F protein 3|nr:ABC-F family ATP-binding cassette domain-containing protein [Clostridiales Family XIII bacterium]